MPAKLKIGVSGKEEVVAPKPTKVSKKVKLKIAVPGQEEEGAPKPSRASKKNKKSWRKNVDMSQVNEYLEEKRFEERTGGSLTDKPDEAIFTVDNETVPVDDKRRKRGEKKLKCFALLDGLPGAPDPMPQRNKTKIKKKNLSKIQREVIQKKHQNRLRDREATLEKKKVEKEEAKTRRRETFDFDLWSGDSSAAAESKKLPQSEWINWETKVHTDTGSSRYVPKFAEKRNFSSGSKLDAVEVPDPGASYNPSLQDHQNLMWKAAMVEIQKEKKEQRIERLTTNMFPTAATAPTHESRMKELSEGIVELGYKDDEEDAEINDDNDDELETEKVVVGTHKPKTRKQLRDRRARMFEDQRRKKKKDRSRKELEVLRVKSINRELKAEEEEAKEKQSMKKARLAEKKEFGPMKLSNYKYEDQEIEIKLSDELTGNLRNISQEGSLLEDRYKSLQRRNVIEVRVPQKRMKGKRKTFEKRGHRMGWEEEPTKIAKRIRMEARMKHRQRQMSRK